jgi:cytochrome c oxidase subunit 2
MAGTVFDPPPPGWDRRLPTDKQFFLWVLLLQALLMIGLSGAWIFVGSQNNPVKQFRTSPEEFAERVSQFVEKHQVGPRSVRVPPGEDAYLLSRAWSFYPDLILKKGQTYTIWYSSVDVTHNPIIAEQLLTFQAVPGHVQGVTLTPTSTGTFLIYCGEYCGIGHQAMMGQITVEE